MCRKCYTNSNAENAVGLAIHPMPKHKETAEKWPLAINCPKDSKAYQHTFLGSLHFEQSDYVEMPQTAKGKSRRLKKG